MKEDCMKKIVAGFYYFERAAIMAVPKPLQAL
jgi:hypothetical protein